MKYFLYLQRQKVTFGYPGRIPRGQDLIDTTQFFNAKESVGYAAESGEQDFIDTTPFFIAKGAF